MKSMNNQPNFPTLPGRFPIVTICLAVALMAGPSSRAAAQTVELDSKRPGLTLSLGLVGTHIDLANIDLFDSGLEIAETGNGVEVQLGYAFTPTFGLELRIVGAEHASGEPNVKTTLAQVHLDAVVGLLSHGRVRPYFAGGIGAGELRAEDANGASLAYDGGLIDMGGGVEVFLSRRFAVSLNYRYALMDLMTVERTGAAPFQRDVDLSSDTHVWGVRSTFSF